MRAWCLLLAACLTSACAHLSLDVRHETAARIAQQSRMTESVIPAGIFNLTAWSRIANPTGGAQVYIEGDGLAWVSKYEKSRNPTPIDPIALRLAVADNAENVIYLARPCQYSGLRDGTPCPDKYWTNARTAPDVIAAYQQALDELKAKHDFAGFNLIGYSGGAAVAALVAAGRHDIMSLRTVAGNIHYTTFTTLHGITEMSGSLKPEDAASALRLIPQIHFIGSADKTVPAIVFDTWKQASGDVSCTQGITVAQLTHDNGWSQAWPALLKTPPACIR